MAERKISKSNAAFPLTVSGLMIVLVCLLIAVKFNLESRLFISSFDHLLFYFILVCVMLLSLIWVLLLGFESSGMSLGSLYKPVKWLLFFVFYPPVKIISRLVRTSKESLQTSLLAFQNNQFLASCQLSQDSRIMLLLPHCLQHHDCKIRITRDINDCEECGKCKIKELKQLGRQYNLKIGIANGGTLARKLVNDYKPDAIIAVACHRDLTDGIRESWKYPVYAILNERPNGPCFDTNVDVNEVRHIIEIILKKHKHIRQP